MLKYFALAVIVCLSFTQPALADKNKLGNSKLKDEGYKRLEGKSPFKVGCSHIIRSGDRKTVYHPTTLTNEAISLNINGRRVSVLAGDKTKLQGAGEVTVWRNCARI